MYDLQETDEGIECQLAVNVLSIHRLTSALLVGYVCAFLFMCMCTCIYVYMYGSCMHW